ncbi:MAG: TolC family protein, partial [Eubacteriales bacterium]|nr:TolC family protein [Eubacteriales bacterium]
GEYMSLEDAMQKAKQNNSNLKNLEDTYSYLQKVRKSVGENLENEDPSNLGSNAFPTTGGSNSNGLNLDTMGYLDNSLSMLRNIKSTETQLKNQEINKQIINDSIDLSLITSVIAIKNTELSITALEKSIEVGKMNIDNLESKYKYGMVSEKDLNSAKTNQKSLESNLEGLKLNLQTQQNNLKAILGTKKDVNLNIETNVDYKDLEKINLEQYINKSVANDLSIQIIKNDVAVAQYNLDTNFNAIDKEKTNLQNLLNSEQRKLNDAQENLEKKIRNAYTNLQTLADKESYLKVSLQNSIDEYNMAVSNYKAGKITLYQVEQAKLAVLNAEKALEENKLSFYSTLYTFSKPYLL